MQNLLRRCAFGQTVSRRSSLWGILLLAVSVAGMAAPVELPNPRLVPKPVDEAPERRARSQPTVPDGATEIPFVETAPVPALTDL